MRVEGIPVAKGLGGGDADVGESQDTFSGREIGEGMDVFAAAEAEDGSADEEEGDVGADLGGDA